MSITNSLAYFTARSAQLPAGENGRLQRATVSGGDRYYVSFSNSSTESCILTIPRLDGYMGGTLYLEVFGYMSSISGGGGVTLKVEHEARMQGDVLDSVTWGDPDSATSGMHDDADKMLLISVELEEVPTNVAGKMLRLRLSRDHADSSTNEFRFVGASLVEYEVPLLQHLADDSTPALGGDLDLNGHDIPVSPSVQDAIDAASTLPVEWEAGTYSEGRMFLHDGILWMNLANGNSGEPGDDPYWLNLTELEGGSGSGGNVNFIGEWEEDAETTYHVGEIVAHAGHVWLCVSECSGDPANEPVLPNDLIWKRLSQKGYRGEFSSSEWDGYYFAGEFVTESGNLFFVPTDNGYEDTSSMIPVGGSTFVGIVVEKINEGLSETQLEIDGLATFVNTVTFPDAVINSVGYQFPSEQGAEGTVLTNDGTGILTWEEISAGGDLTWRGEWDSGTASSPGYPAGSVVLYSGHLYMTDQENFGEPTMSNPDPWRQLTTGEAENPFDQELNSSDSPYFAGLTIENVSPVQINGELNVDFSVMCGDLTSTGTAIIIPPTSDPHVAGALWNDGGTPTFSAG